MSLEFIPEAFTLLTKEKPSQIEQWDEVISSLFKHVTTIDLKTEIECLQLLNVFSLSKKLHDEIEDYRKQEGEPHRKAIQRINDQMKVFTSFLDEIMKIINQKREAFEQAEIKRLEQAKIEAKEQSAALGMDLSIYVPESPKKLVSEHATTTTKEVKAYKVTDEALIPREYLIVDPVAIKQAINMGIREIPGIEITVEKKTTIRRR